MTTTQKIKRKYRDWFRKPILMLLATYIILCAIQGEVESGLFTVIFISLIMPPLTVVIDSLWDKYISRKG